MRFGLKKINIVAKHFNYVQNVQGIATRLIHEKLLFFYHQHKIKVREIVELTLIPFFLQFQAIFQGISVHLCQINEIK